MLVISAAALLVVLAGFATQRGTICAVQAVRDVFERGAWFRFASFLECAAWAALILMLGAMLGLRLAGDVLAYELGLTCMLGGALFGLGALANGACAFGSVARLAGGDLSYLVMPPAFLLGAMLCGDQWQPAPLTAAMSPVWPAALATLAAIALTSFVVWRVFTAVKGARRRSVARVVSQTVWPPAVAVFIVAAVNSSVLFLVGSWPFTGLLSDIARDGEGDLVRAGLALAFVLGAIVGGVSARRFRLLRPGIAALGRRLLGGMLMGAGAMLIPGGNDRLILLDLPLLHLHAAAAYATMMVAIFAGMGTKHIFWTRGG